MECAICFNVIKKSCVPNCMHHFCYSCIIKWCKFGGATCPLCKTFLSELKFDNEFDMVNKHSIKDINNDITKKDLHESDEVLEELIQLALGAPLLRRIVCQSEHVLNIDFKNLNTHPGITIKTNIPYGVKIINVNKKDECFKQGLRKNDIIIFINNIPCISHEQTINIIKDMHSKLKNIKCKLLR
jgi:hypothetical protein